MTGRTKMLGVIGWPVAQSLSPQMQNAGLRALGLQEEWAYAAFPVRPEELDAAVRGARALGLRGLNVTIPHKEAALRLCQPDALSARAGAVNTLVFPDDPAAPIIGHNTDVAGFQALCRDAGVDLQGRPLRAVVLGAGGAARAVVLALREAGAAITLAARRPDPLHVDGAAITPLPLRLEGLAPALRTCDLLIDCTPRGLAAPAPLQATHPELDLALLPAAAVVLDLVVRPSTPLVAAARARGLGAHAGATMLLHQGLAALGCWLGRQPGAAAEAAMRDALRAALLL